MTSDVEQASKTPFHTKEERLYGAGIGFLLLPVKDELADEVEVPVLSNAVGHNGMKEQGMDIYGAVNHSQGGVQQRC